MNEEPMKNSMNEPNEEVLGTSNLYLIVIGTGKNQPGQLQSQDRHLEVCVCLCLCVLGRA